MTDRQGWAVRVDTTGMVPVELRLYYDRKTRRYYNAQGRWVDNLGRPLPHRGPPGQHRSRGRHFGNTNPGGPGANPPHVWGRYGPRSELAEMPSRGSASRSGSQNPPWHTGWGQPAAARGPPAAAQGKGKGKGSDRGKGKGSDRGSDRGKGQRAATPRSSRASSTGPPPRTERGRADRADWKRRDHWKHRDGWNAGNDWQSEWWEWGR